MNKDQLQQELKEKIKAGIKPSHLKKGGQKQDKTTDLPPPISIDEGYQSDKSDKSTSLKKTKPENNPIPPIVSDNNIPTPPASNIQLLTLKKQIELHQEIKKADEKKKQELQQKISNLQKTIQDLDYLLKTGKNSEVIKKLRTENKNLIEKYTNLEKQVKSKGEVKESLFNCYHCKKPQALSLLVLELPEGKLCQPCWTILRKKTKEQIKPTITPFTCHNCKENKKEKVFKVKLDATLIEYSICSQCLPLIKEYNEKEQDSDRKLEEWE